MESLKKDDRPSPAEQWAKATRVERYREFAKQAFMRWHEVVEEEKHGRVNENPR